MHLRECEFALVLRIVQRERHRDDDQQTVFAAPWHRFVARQQVREWTHPQRRKTGVDAVAVDIDRIALILRQRRDRGLHARTHAMRTRSAIGRQRDCAEQFGQLTGGAAAQQIHFEETLLRVHVAERPVRVATVLGAQGHAAERIAFNADGLRQRRAVHVALVLRQAATKCEPTGDEQQHAGHRYKHAKTEDETEWNAHSSFLPVRARAS